MGTHRLTSTRVAIKQIPKDVSPQLTREIHHHRRLHHPHVTQLYEVIATETSIWLVTELCAGGELFDYLAEKGRLSETETRRLIGQLCLALHYVHSSKAVHRDLKLENVLLDDRCNVKIGDFGFTREYENGRMLETFCGTTGYAAPEMLLGQKYSGPGTLYFHIIILHLLNTSTEVDIWSLGIILYTLLTGTLPYDDDDEDVMKAKIINGEFDNPDWLSGRESQLFTTAFVKPIHVSMQMRAILFPQSCKGILQIACLYPRFLPTHGLRSLRMTTLCHLLPISSSTLLTVP